MFCLSLEPNHYTFIKNLGYIPVGLGDKDFDSNWFRDISGKNISKKNKNYGEYTFHYWIWKNYMGEISDEWIGFCQYRKFWSLNKNDNLNFSNLNNHVLKEIPEKFNEYDTILGEPIFINQFKAAKFIKKGLKKYITSDENKQQDIYNQMFPLNKYTH